MQVKQILNVTLIANEAINSRIKSKNVEMACKLDIDNAYDHIKWDLS